MTLLIVHTVLLAWVSHAIARRLVPEITDRVMATAMLFWGNIVALSLLLSQVGKLGEPSWFFRGSLLLGLATLWLVRHWVGPVPPTAAPPAAGEKRSRLLIAAVFGTLGLMLLTNLRVASVYEPNNYDSLTYHLPRVMYYLGQNSLSHFETADIRQVYFTFNFNLLQLFCFIYGPPLQAINFLNVAAWVITGLGVYRLSRLCGCGFNASLSAAWLALTATEVLAQATSTTLDLPTAAILLSALVYALRWRQSQRTSDAMLAGLAAGLAGGAKLTVVFFGPTVVLLLLVFWYQHWRRGALPSLYRDVRAWLAPGVLALLLSVPFIIYNLAATGHWMTNKLDFTQNIPFRFACAVQTAKGYLLQLFVEPLGRFSFDLDLIGRLNGWFSRTFLSGWNEAYAYSGLYVIPPDLNEDHVWYGFAGPLFLVCAILCLGRDRKLKGPLSWLALLALGWFATYFGMNKWSLYIQRYFLPAIVLMGPCAAAVLDAGPGGSRLVAFGKRLVFGVIAATALWFSVSYLAQNHNRPAFLPYSHFTPPQVLPDIPPKLQQRLPGQSRINVITDGTNERIFLLMTLGRHQRFTSSQQVDPQKYNLFSYWGFTRNNIFSNIAHIASYTVVSVPTKKTAGVEFLGTVGEGVNAFDYVGLAPHAESTAATPDTSNIVVLVYYGPKDPDRFAHSRLRVDGLNPRDGARVEISAEMADGTRVPLMAQTHSGDARMSLTKPFKRLKIQVFEVATGREIGFGELPYTTKPTEADTPAPLSPTTLFLTELISPGAARNMTVNGLADMEGPYIKWDLPLFRWAKQPAVHIEIPANPRLKRLRLTFSLRIHMRDEAHLEILHNGRTVQNYYLQGRTDWHTQVIDLTPTPGDNVIELRDRPDNAAPDWLGYLEKNPDVKKYLLSAGKPLEAGAKEHYELFGRSEHRILPMQQNAAPSAPPPESLYFIYRSLRIEGFSAP